MTALYFTGIVCFTPTAGLGNSSDSAGNSLQRFCTWINLVRQSHTSELPISPKTHYPCRNQGFAIPNLLQVTLCTPKSAPRAFQFANNVQTKNRAKQIFVGVKREWCVGVNPVESLGMSKVGEPNIASFSAGSERLWWMRTKLKIHRC